MRRASAFLVLAAIVMLATAWFADRPGAVSVVWQGWRIDTSFGLLVAGIAIVAALAVLGSRFWNLLVHGPAQFRRWRRERRRRQGYAALTHGLVAVAAGDPDEARRHARRADVLLDEPPLNMLLAAQTSQLLGDEEGAKRHFTRMLDRPETEFLGLRGLITQALKAGQRDEALRLGRRARALRPRTAWVQTTLFELETRAGDWQAAAETLREANRVQALSPAAAKRAEAAVALELARRHESEGRAGEALAAIERAWKAEPNHPAVAPELARAYLASGKARSAARIVEQAWARQPHPDLLEPYLAARGAAEKLQRARQIERLAALAPRHVESHLALARAMLEAKLWGEARRHLQGAIAASGDVASAGTCRLMARVAEEEEEKADQAAAHGWLEKAASAPPDHRWLCGACGTAHERWQAICANCASFDRIDWTRPLQAAPSALAQASGGRSMLPAVTGAPQR